jgi:hypothetical protein
MAFFKSEQAFLDAYRRKLALLLHERGSAADFGLSAFILVCANAYFDHEILAELNNDLRKAFLSVREKYFRLLAEGHILNERNSEDLLVFLKIALVGLEQLRVAEFKQLDEWTLQFNHIRSFRPQRAAARHVASIDIPFNENAFHYDAALCQRESFWSGLLMDKQVSLLYNKYPFARLHALMLPEPEKKLKQYLDREYHAWAWQVTQTLAEDLPGFGMGYNSLGTFASVNHLHFQTFIQPHGMPVANAVWKHNGGEREYPLGCRVFDKWEDAWQWMEQIYKQNTTSFNLLYTPGKVYGFERKRQGTYRHTPWTSGFAFYELSGNMITFSREDYTMLTNDQIEKEFKKLKPAPWQRHPNGKNHFISSRS